MPQSNDRASWIQGHDANCSKPGPVPARPYRLVLLGAPGIGKGTQAEILQTALHACHLSTGDVFRAAKCCQDHLSKAMEEALKYMKRGDLVPDATVIDMVRERVRCLGCVRGFLLDGFPRTVDQAEALDRLLGELGIGLDAVLDYELAREKVIERLSGRRSCPGCGRSYHVTKNPAKLGVICDDCGTVLVQREDDRPEAIAIRMEAYQRSTEPLIGYYRRKGLLVVVDADGSPNEVGERALAALSGCQIG